MTAPPFEKSVFINCPFDEEYAPILQAVAFCVVYLGLHPRLAPENADSSEPRLERIVDLVRGSKFGIHDLSRSRSGAAGEYARLNMPFELGIDYGARRFSNDQLARKAILVLEEGRYDYQKSLSDISGWDIEPHGGKPDVAVRKVRSWLLAKADVENIGSARITSRYEDFQQWYWEAQRAAGSSDEDIRAYPTTELVNKMHEWLALGQPMGSPPD